MLTQLWATVTDRLFDALSSLPTHVHTQGTVIIIANHGNRIDIPANACLENKIVSGNLRILDH